jgi:hypothetical protein
MFWSAVFISSVRNKTGDVVQHFASFVDPRDRSDGSELERWNSLEFGSLEIIITGGLQ